MKTIKIFYNSIAKKSTSTLQGNLNYQYKIKQIDIDDDGDGELSKSFFAEVKRMFSKVFGDSITVE